MTGAVYGRSRGLRRGNVSAASENEGAEYDGLLRVPQPFVHGLKPGFADVVRVVFHVNPAPWLKFMDENQNGQESFQPGLRALQVYSDPMEGLEAQDDADN